MTFVSNDPSLWPYLGAQLFLTYWTSVLYQSVMFRSDIDLHFAVTASVVVVYDWGEQDVLNLLPFL
jgi:hypothetical protein